MQPIVLVATVQAAVFPQRMSIRIEPFVVGAITHPEDCNVLGVLEFSSESILLAASAQITTGDILVNSRSFRPLPCPRDKTSPHDNALLGQTSFGDRATDPHLRAHRYQ